MGFQTCAKCSHRSDGFETCPKCGWSLDRVYEEPKVCKVEQPSSTPSSENKSFLIALSGLLVWAVVMVASFYFIMFAWPVLLVFLEIGILFAFFSG